MKYAVIETGGQQFKVTEGAQLNVEFLSVELGSSVVFDQVFLLSSEDRVTVGRPYVPGVQVVATIVMHGRHPKIRIFKMRRRKHYQKHQGHRQYFTKIQIDTIVCQPS